MPISLRLPGRRPRSLAGPAECSLDTVGDVGVVAEDLTKEVGQEGDQLRGHAMVSGAGCVVLDCHRHVGDGATGGPAQLGRHVCQCVEAGAGQLVDFAPMAILGQRREGHIGDVVGIDEWLLCLAAR